MFIAKFSLIEITFKRFTYIQGHNFRTEINLIKWLLLLKQSIFNCIMSVLNQKKQNPFQHSVK